jgi:hypothetical protein
MATARRASIDIANTRGATTTTVVRATSRSRRADTTANNATSMITARPICRWLSRAVDAGFGVTAGCGEQSGHAGAAPDGPENTASGCVVGKMSWLAVNATITASVSPAMTAAASHQGT